MNISTATAAAAALNAYFDLRLWEGKEKEEEEEKWDPSQPVQAGPLSLCMPLTASLFLTDEVLIFDFHQTKIKVG